jgi:membrane protease YdiL (CAAX protease family)
MAGTPILQDRGGAASSALTRFRDGFLGRPRPEYPPTPADRRVVRIMGLDLPLRATTAIFVATFVELFDYSRTAIPRPILDLNLAAGAIRYQALERTILFGLVPLLVVLLAFRDHPRNYGLRLGDWRWGLGLSVVGMAAMTPLVLALAQDPSFARFYAPSAARPADVALTALIDLAPSEFVFRGFLMFTLLRAMGPLGMVVAQLPFVFSHLNKPEIELLSTLFGGLVYGWVDWRTRSIVWSILPHVYIITLATLAAAAAWPAT